MANLYVTFFVYDTITEGRKMTVECENDRQAKNVACDVCSFDGVNNVRLRQCGKPHKDRRIISYKDYWNYQAWLNN